MNKNTSKAYTIFLRTCRELAEMQEKRFNRKEVNNDELQQKIGALEILVEALGLKSNDGQDIKSSMKKLKFKNYKLLVSQTVNIESVYIEE